MLFRSVSQSRYKRSRSMAVLPSRNLPPCNKFSNQVRVPRQFSSGGYITTKAPEKSARIKEALDYNPRFFRSVNLQNDFNDPLSLNNYILTSFAYECLSRISKGLHHNSSQRAWRITGDFGTGKSSFALLLAHWFAGNQKQLPKHLKESLARFEQKDYPTKYLPILINGTRGSLSQTLAKTLSSAIATHFPPYRYTEMHRVRRPQDRQSYASQGPSLVSIRDL